MRRIVHTLRSAKYATEIQLEDLRVLHDNILGKVGGGFAIANDRLSRQRILCRGVSRGGDQRMRWQSSSQDPRDL